MARIRTIKPTFWTDGNIIKLTSFARLMYIGMWNFALCDEGHVADDAYTLKLQILPADDVDADELLAELMDLGRVERLTIPGGRTFLHVTRMPDHQKVDPRWNTRCPVCKALQTSPELATTQESLGATHRNSPELGLGKESKGKESTSSKTASTAQPSKEFDEFWNLYPRKVGKQAAAKAFAKARKSTDADVILRGVAVLTRQVQGKDPQFTPHASSWLNGERWLDEAPRTQQQVPALYAHFNQ